MNVRPSAWFMALLLVTACPEKGNETEAEEEKSTSTAEKSDKGDSGTTAAGGPTATQAATPAPNPTPTAATTETAPTPMGITPMVKSEVDNKPEGLTGGTKLNAANAKAAIEVPKDWAVTKGETTVAKTADDKSRIIVTGFGAEGPDQRMAQATQAGGLTNCQWSTPPETATVGKDKLTASVADGVCNRGAGQVKAAMMATEGLLVIGSWDEGASPSLVFNSFRSVAKAVGVDPLAACCAALRQNSKSAPPQQAPMYMMAAQACDNARKNPDTVRALASIRGMLVGANVPASCR